MTKQKKTAAKPITRGTKIRTQPAEVVAAPKTKLGRLEGMLRRPEGATIGQIAKALDWQVQRVRGAISVEMLAADVVLYEKSRSLGNSEAPADDWMQVLKSTKVDALLSDIPTPAK